jgi:hypothetical protein
MLAITGVHNQLTYRQKWKRNGSLRESLEHNEANFIHIQEAMTTYYSPTINHSDNSAQINTIDARRETCLFHE